LELLIRDMVRACIVSRMIGGEDAMKAGFGMLHREVVACHVSLAQLMLSTSWVAQRALEIVERHRVRRKVKEFDGVGGVDRALSSLVSPFTLLMAASATSGGMWALVRYSGTYASRLLELVRELEEDDELVSTVGRLVEHAALASTFEERGRTLMRDVPEGEDERWVSEKQEAVYNLLSTSATRLRTRLEESGVSREETAAAEELWELALLTTGPTQLIVEAALSVLTDTIGKVSSRGDIEEPTEHELRDLERSMVLAMEVAPAAALMAAVLYSPVEVYKVEMAVGGNAMTALLAMLEEGREALGKLREAVERAPEPGGELVRLWHQELMLWTPFHVVISHVALAGLQDEYWKEFREGVEELYQQLKEGLGRKRRRTKRRGKGR
jgi:hypothetical protein